MKIISLPSYLHRKYLHFLTKNARRCFKTPWNWKVDHSSAMFNHFTEIAGLCFRYFFNVTLLFPHSSSIFYCIPVMVTVMLFSLIVTHCKEKKAFFPLISAFFSSNNFLGKINMLVQDKSASLQAGSPIFWISISLLPPNHNFWQITAKWVSMSKDVWSVQKYFCTFGVLPVIYSK